MAKKLVGSREANQQFSALIKGIEDNGDVVIITRRGHPVVRMERAAQERDPEQVAREIDEVFETYARPIGVKSLDRQALHERDMKMFRR